MMGERIRRLRLALRLSQQQLAGAEMTRAFISQVESGRCTPSRENLQVIAQRLGKPVEYFLHGADDEDGELLQSLALLESAQRDLDGGADLATADRKLQQVLKLATRLERTDLEAKARSLLVHCLLRAGRHEDVQEQAELAVDSFRTLSDRDGMARMYAKMGEAALIREEYLVSRRAFEKALLYSSGLKSMQDFRAVTLMYLASCLFRLGRISEAANRYAEALGECAVLDAPGLVGAISMGLGWALYESGDLQGALERTREAVAAFERAGSQARVQAMHNLAVIQAARGHWEESYVTLRSCVEIYRSQGRADKQASALEEIARYWVHKGQPAKAEAMCWEAIYLLDVVEDGVLRGRLYRMLGQLAAEGESWEQAHHYLRLSVDIFRRLKAEAEAAASHAALEKVLPMLPGRRPGPSAFGE